MSFHIIQKKQIEKTAQFNSARKTAGCNKLSEKAYNNLPHIPLFKNIPSDGFSLSAQNIHFLQRTIGNQAIREFIQAKLKIGQPGDKYEQEADRVAEAVMRMPAPRIQREPT